MLAKTTCLHIPPLYEEGTAQIMWESSEGADGYELDVHYDEDFETASTGKTWSDIENANLSAAEIEALNLTWEQIAKLPAQGLSWRNIEFHNPTWSEIDASNQSWQDIQKLPVEFIVYKGLGEKTQGPDQGLAWANIDSSGLGWSQIEDLGWTWESFMLRPSIGMNWSQLHSENLSWAEMEAKGQTWRDFECQAARGLGWGSLEGRFLEWSEMEAKNVTWKQFENLPPDSKTHIAHFVDIPIYKKKAIFRVRVYKGREYSDYLTSSLIDTLPRSLSKYKPPCLHIPTLYREGTVRIIWGELYGAAGYILERQVNGGEFVEVPGQATLVPPPFAGYTWSEWKAQNLTWKQFEDKGMSWFQIESLPTQGFAWGDWDGLWLTWKEIEGKGLTWKQLEMLEPHEGNHFALEDSIPLYAKKIVYRIKAYNTTDSSQYLGTATINTLPRSIAKYKPPCLHIPELHEGKSAEIIWGDLYDASGYVLERKLGGKEFSGVFNGPGKQVSHPSDCGKPNLLLQTPDCKQHLACTDKLPYYEKTAQYRIRGYNTTDSSQYLESAVIPIIPVFYREDSLTLSLKAGSRYYIRLCGRELKSISGLVMTLSYDSQALSLVNFAAQTDGTYTKPGTIVGTDLNLLSIDSDAIRFQFNKNTASSKMWSGLLSLLELTALQTKTITITLS